MDVDEKGMRKPKGESDKKVGIHGYL